MPAEPQRQLARKGPPRLLRRVFDGRHERQRPARFQGRRRAETPGPGTNSEAGERTHAGKQSNRVCGPLVVSIGLQQPSPSQEKGHKELLAAGRRSPVTGGPEASHRRWLARAEATGAPAPGAGSTSRCPISSKKGLELRIKPGLPTLAANSALRAPDIQRTACARHGR